MKRRGFDNKRDANENEIIKAFKKAGVGVWKLDQPFDLLICIGEILFLVEVKHGHADLNENQTKLAKDWPVNVIRSPVEAVQFVNSVRRMAA